MVRRLVTLFDSITLVPEFKSDERLVIDSFFQTTDPALNIDIAATHAGIITRNNGFYLPERMRDGAKSFLDNYNKPILLHHDNRKDAIGRVLSAEYKDTSGSLQIQNSYFKDFYNDISFIKSVELVDKLLKDGHLTDESFGGLGFIQLGARITDKDAIEKFLDKRYLTVSVGATTDRAVCSICKEDWVENGEPCEHTPGKTYDEKPAFIIAGNLKYDECSIVNGPADPFAKVIYIHGQNGFQDSIEIEVEPIGKVPVIKVELMVKDQTSKEASPMTVTPKAPKAESKQPEDGATAQDLKADKQVQDNKDKKDKPSEGVQDSDSSESSEGNQDPDTADVTDAVKLLEDRLVAMKMFDLCDEELVILNKNLIEDKNNLILSDKNLFEKCNDILYEDMFEFAKAIGMDVEDKKLTAADRRALSSKSFCGPNRSFPVNDCGHAKAAMARAKQFNKPPNVIACIRRKAKALGCPFNGKSKDCFNEKEITQMLADYAARDKSADDKQTHFDNFIPNGTQLSDKVNDGLLKQLYKDALVLMYQRGFLEKTNETDVDAEELKAQIEDQDMQLEALRIELRDAWHDLAIVEERHRDLAAANIRFMSSAIVDLRRMSGKTIEDVEAAIAEESEKSTDVLESVLKELQDSIDMDKVFSKLNDGTAQRPQEDLDDPTIDNNNNSDGAESVEDNSDTDSVEDLQSKQYFRILGEEGHQAANKFLDNLKKYDIVDRNFVPKKEDK